MPTCACLCKRTEKSGLQFYRFPKSPERRAKWVQNTRRINEDGKPWLPKDSDRICEVKSILWHICYFFPKIYINNITILAI